MALGGPVQGQILGATTFTNSGTIDLQANPVAGDVLLISGGHAPGTNGGGAFVERRPPLKLDTVLNEGGAASTLGRPCCGRNLRWSGGATAISIRNAGGAGALTVGDGILVVQVLDPSRFGIRCLRAGWRGAGGALDYDLFHGGLNGSNPSDWFLRTPSSSGRRSRSRRSRSRPSCRRGADTATRSAAADAAAGCLSDHRAGDRDLRRGPADRPAIGDDDARHLA